MKKKKAIIAIVVVIIIVACAVGAWYLLGKGGIGGDSADRVFVESVKSLNGNAVGVQNRYTGVVEAQDTVDVNKNAERSVEELYVAVGDRVEVGTPLFKYDVTEAQNSLDQGRLSLEETQNSISNYNQQIASLQAQMATVSEDEKFNYMTEIQSIQTSIKEAEYSLRSTQTEIDGYQKTINEATVLSEAAGTIKTISEEGMDEYGNSSAYISILSDGDYRVKGSINEQNVWTIAEETPVIIRSRVDDTQTWTGTITKVDTENQIENSSNTMYMDTSDSSETNSTNYPFYITLDSVEGLMLGQHVYIEMDEGQNEEKEGIWLFSGYLAMDDEMAEGDLTEGTDISGDMGAAEYYVWADNGNGKLEKRSVEVGEYDPVLDEYQIISGLTEDDLIAWPTEGFYEGITTVTDIDEVDYSSSLYNSETESESYSDEMIEDMDMDIDGGEMLDEEMLDEEMLDEDMGTDVDLDDAGIIAE